MRLWPIVAIASAVILGVGIASNWPTWLLALLCVAALAGIYVVHARDTLGKTAVLSYDFDSDMESAYAELHNAASPTIYVRVGLAYRGIGKSS